MVLPTQHTKAQKSGILKKDYYGAFNGDDWEDFMAGKRAEDFNKKSNVSLSDYLSTSVKRFVTEELKETSIASAVANSTVQSFPTDATVVTQNTAGEWIKRNAYPGERGYFHTPTGMYWLSFSCGNLTAFGPGPAVTKKSDMAYIPPTLAPTTNSAGTNVTINDNRTQEVPWSVGYGIYSQGRNDRQTDLIVDASIFTKIQDAKDCNSCGTSGSSGFVSASTAQFVQAAPAAYQVPAQQTGGTVVVQQRGGNEWLREFTANTAANVAGEGLNRLIYGPRTVRVVGNYQQSYYSGYTGYYPQYPSGGGFQGSNQPGGNSLPYNNGTGGGGYNNTFFQGQ